MHKGIDCWINFLKTLWVKLSVHSHHDSYYLALPPVILWRVISWCTWLKVFRVFASTSLAAWNLFTPIQSSVHRLLRPACGGFAVDVGKAREMLRVFILWVSAWAKGGVHVPWGGIPGWMHRWAGVAAVSWWHIRPPGGNRCRMQPGIAAHQARLHPRHLSIELVLRKRRRGHKLSWRLDMVSNTHTWNSVLMSTMLTGVEIHYIILFIPTGAEVVQPQHTESKMTQKDSPDFDIVHINSKLQNCQNISRGHDALLIS